MGHMIIKLADMTFSVLDLVLFSVGRFSNLILKVCQFICMKMTGKRNFEIIGI